MAGDSAIFFVNVKTAFVIKERLNVSYLNGGSCFYYLWGIDLFN
jgi:hypothetical protein